MNTATSKALDFVEEFAKKLKDSNDRVQMYDFGESTTVMPCPDAGENLYRTSSICYLVVKGEQPPLIEPFSTEERGNCIGLRDLGNGNFIFGIELLPPLAHADIFSALVSAREKLLEASHV